eukprot:jgi/Galph1/5414/GphlegSOOS_G4030.1
MKHKQYCIATVGIRSQALSNRAKIKKTVLRYLVNQNRVFQGSYYPSSQLLELPNIAQRAAKDILLSVFGSEYSNRPEIQILSCDDELVQKELVNKVVEYCTGVLSHSSGPYGVFSNSDTISDLEVCTNRFLENYYGWRDLEAYLTYHFVRKLVPLSIHKAPIPTKEVRTDLHNNNQSMKPLKSHLHYALDRQIVVTSSLCERRKSRRNDPFNVLSSSICTHIQPKATLTNHEDLVASLKFVPFVDTIDPILCTFSLDDKVRIFSGSYCRSTFAGPVQQTGGTTVESEGKCHQIAACSLRGEVCLFDIEMGHTVASISTPLNYSRFGRENIANRVEWYAITSSKGNIATGGNHGVVALWDPQISQPVEYFRINRKSEEPKIRSVAMDPSCSLVAAASGKLVYIWDIRFSMSPLVVLKSPASSQGPIDHILFEPLSSHHHMFAGYRDGSIHRLKIFDNLPRNTRVFHNHVVPKVGERPVSVNFDTTPNGRNIVGLASGGKVAVYDVLGSFPDSSRQLLSPIATRKSGLIASSMIFGERRKTPAFLGTFGGGSSEVLRVAVANNLNYGGDILFATTSTLLDVTLWGMK